MAVGYLDTNVFVHAITKDEHSDECRRFLEAVERGEIQARLEPIIVHEISYALPRFARQLDREDVAIYLLSVLEWPGILADKPILIETIQRWRQTPRLGFADAYLAAIAARDQAPVLTKNIRDLSGQGVDVPVPLPEAANPS
jgi:predicted nucleic acid-binding protein